MQDLEINTKMLHSMQSELFKMQYVYARIAIIAKDKLFMDEVDRG